MGKLNLSTDEASLLKTYRVSSLTPRCVRPTLLCLRPLEVVCRKWEDVNHEAVNSVAGALTNAQGDTESDPLGLRRGSIAE